jgi:deoxycytidine triphosphate deaminase
VIPYDPDNVNPASIDLRLGDYISVPRWYWRNPITRLIAWHILQKPDPKGSPHLYWSEFFKFHTFTLWPRQFVLCHSNEVTQIPDDCAAILLSKSTTGRIGLEHLHAGYGDPGFDAQWTWELVNLSPWPIELVAGQRLTQLVLIRLEDKATRNYSETGRYQGQKGPTAARGPLEQ